MPAESTLKDRYVCAHCGARPPRGDYMVHDAVWTRSGMQRRGFLCLGCLDERLVASGHERLTLSDFTNVPSNAALKFGYELAMRAKVSVHVIEEKQTAPSPK